jgi:undecaprenyl diphosphate synthase
MYAINPDLLPRHVAIIMDGNGRWAKQRLRNRLFGHDEGTKSVREIVRCCRDLDIPYLTLYAFSKENWQRPESEVKALWRLLKRFLHSEAAELVDKEIRLHHLGDREGIPKSVLLELESIERETAKFDKLVLTLALNYGGRQEIVRAVKHVLADVLTGRLAVDEINQESFSLRLYTAQLPDPDLIIRTGGEYRLSNFLLWQLAYAELYFTNVLWPDFREPQFLEALMDFQKRERRFGKISEQVRLSEPRGLGVVSK